jgi:hypothetical protein
MLFSSSAYNIVECRMNINDEVEKMWKEAVMANCKVRGCIQKFPDWPPGARTANGTALCHQVQLYHSVSQSSEFRRHNALCCFSTSVCHYFVIDSVRKLLDTPSYYPSINLEEL